MAAAELVSRIEKWLQEFGLNNPGDSNRLQ
jgi:hypothetical protein